MSISGLTPLKPLNRRFQSSNRPSKWVISGALKWTILGGVLETPNPMAPGSLLMLLNTPHIALWGIRMCYGPRRVPQDPPKGVQNGSPDGSTLGYLWVLGSLEGVILETRIYRSEPIIHSFHIRTTQMATDRSSTSPRRSGRVQNRVPKWTILG